MRTLAPNYVGLLLTPFLLGLVGPAQAAAPKTDAAKIANAMSAAPAALSRNASIAEMNEDGSMKELRHGTNGWTCVPDDPSSPGNDPMCLDPNAMEWLHAYMKKEPPPEKVGFIYQAGRGQADDHRSARYGRRPCRQVDPRLRPHGERREREGPLRDVEGHALRAPNGANALGSVHHTRLSVFGM
jgi:hypothetical protein